VHIALYGLKSHHRGT